MLSIIQEHMIILIYHGNSIKILEWEHFMLYWQYKYELYHQLYIENVILVAHPVPKYILSKVPESIFLFFTQA